MCYVSILWSSQYTSIARCRARHPNHNSFSRVFRLKTKREWTMIQMERSTRELQPPMFLTTRRTLIGCRRGEWKEDGEAGWPTQPWKPLPSSQLVPSSPFASLRMLPRSFQLSLSLHVSLSEVPVTCNQETHDNTVYLPENEFLKLPTHRLLQMKIKPQTPEYICFQEGVSGN